MAVAEELRELWSMAAPITAMNCVVYLRAMVSVVCLGRGPPGARRRRPLHRVHQHHRLLRALRARHRARAPLQPVLRLPQLGPHLPLPPAHLPRPPPRRPPHLLLLDQPRPHPHLLGQDPTITSAAASYCLWSLPDLLTNAFLQPLRVFLRSQGVTKPMAACSAAAVLLHVPLSFLLAFRFGIPGVAAAAVATNLNMVLFLLAYLRLSGACDLTWRGWSSSALRGLSPLLRLPSLPASASASSGGGTRS
ncbi:putative protein DETOXIFICATION 54 [Iris pallida]|uniref:Protein DETOXIFICATION n=1 Tax=Iris pallida TaxID=29817 RepID=A0AAX6HA26_IRIPA|nr:putative protein DETOXIFICATION 54 [Iris pallida]